MKLVRLHCLAAVTLPVLLIATGAAAQDAPAVPAFSAMPPGGPPPGWIALRPAPKVPDTRYALVDDVGTTVLKAQADKSMSGLSFPVRVDLRTHPRLQWRWKVEASVAQADMTTREGDDYAARIYVMFDLPREHLPLGTRAKLALGEALYGQTLPTAALNYVWDNRQPIGTIQPNAYTERARMIVLQSGNVRAGEWVTETRDLAADFRAAFGEAAPNVVGIALATDTDNTGARATAWYGDIRFLRRDE